MIHTTYNFTYGKFFGYPQCCIEAFGDIAIPYFLRSEVSQSAACNGFLPCERCGEKLLNKRITYEELINLNRKCSVPFKLIHTSEEECQIKKEFQVLRAKIKEQEILGLGFKKWEAFTSEGSPEHGQEVIAIHKGKEEEMMYDSKYAAFLSRSIFLDRPNLMMSEAEVKKAGFPPHGKFYCLGAKYQEYVTHWKPKENKI